jgi:galactokinase
VDLAMLEAARGELDPRVHDRALHVITENERVLEAVAALDAGDHAALGRAFAASHASLRDRYEVSSPELDALVDIALGTPGVVGSRMTGAGFGGCTVTLARPDAVEALRRRVATEYPARTGLRATLWELRAAGGAGFLPV